MTRYNAVMLIIQPVASDIFIALIFTSASSTVNKLNIAIDTVTAVKPNAIISIVLFHFLFILSYLQHTISQLPKEKFLLYLE